MPHVHNGLHEYTRLLDAAARAIGEKSGAQDFSGIERFGETLTPTMDLWALPEWALLRGEILFGRSVFNAANPATFQSVEVVNPAGSNVLAVLLEIDNRNGGVEPGLDVGPALGVVATVRGAAHDGRYPFGELSRCTLVLGRLAGPTAIPQDNLIGGSRTSRPYILVPGTKLMLIAPAANTDVGLSVFWSERVLLPSEERA